MHVAFDIDPLAVHLIGGVGLVVMVGLIYFASHVWKVLNDHERELIRTRQWRTIFQIMSDPRD